MQNLTSLYRVGEQKVTAEYGIVTSKDKTLSFTLSLLEFFRKKRRNIIIQKTSTYTNRVVQLHWSYFKGATKFRTLT